MKKRLIALILMLVMVLSFGLAACGEAGEQGPKGDTGATGQQGPQGQQGPAGEDGKDGKDGVDGKDASASEAAFYTPERARAELLALQSAIKTLESQLEASGNATTFIYAEVGIDKHSYLPYTKVELADDGTPTLTMGELFFPAGNAWTDNYTAANPTIAYNNPWHPGISGLDKSSAETVDGKLWISIAGTKFKTKLMDEAFTTDYSHTSGTQTRGNVLTGKMVRFVSDTAFTIGETVYPAGTVLTDNFLAQNIEWYLTACEKKGGTGGAFILDETGKAYSDSSKATAYTDGALDKIDALSTYQNSRGSLHGIPFANGMKALEDFLEAYMTTYSVKAFASNNAQGVNIDAGIDFGYKYNKSTQLTTGATYQYAASYAHVAVYAYYMTLINFINGVNVDTALAKVLSIETSLITGKAAAKSTLVQNALAAAKEMPSTANIFALNQAITNADYSDTDKYATGTATAEYSAYEPNTELWATSRVNNDAKYEVEVDVVINKLTDTIVDVLFTPGANNTTGGSYQTTWEATWTKYADLVIGKTVATVAAYTKTTGSAAVTAVKTGATQTGLNMMASIVKACQAFPVATTVQAKQGTIATVATVSAVTAATESAPAKQTVTIANGTVGQKIEIPTIFPAGARPVALTYATSAMTAASGATVEKNGTDSFTLTLVANTATPSTAVFTITIAKHGDMEKDYVLEVTVNISNIIANSFTIANRTEGHSNPTTGVLAGSGTAYTLTYTSVVTSGTPANVFKYVITPPANTVIGAVTFTSTGLEAGLVALSDNDNTGFTLTITNNTTKDNVLKVKMGDFEVTITITVVTTVLPAPTAITLSQSTSGSSSQTSVSTLGGTAQSLTIAIAGAAFDRTLTYNINQAANTKVLTAGDLTYVTNTDNTFLGHTDNAGIATLTPDGLKFTIKVKANTTSGLKFTVAIPDPTGGESPVVTTITVTIATTVYPAANTFTVKTADGNTVGTTNGTTTLTLTNAATATGYAFVIVWPDNTAPRASLTYELKNLNGSTAEVAISSESATGFTLTPATATATTGNTVQLVITLEDPDIAGKTICVLTLTITITLTA